MAYTVYSNEKIEEKFHFDAAPVPAREMMRLIAVPAPQHYSKHKFFSLRLFSY
jgi:hypothetical protein